MTVLDDTFTRANSTTTLGSTEANSGTTGTQAWSTSAGTWGVISNRAYRTGTPNQHEQATLDLGSTNHEIYGDLYGATGENPGLCVRWQDTSNLYLLQATIGSPPQLYIKLAGTFFSLGTPTGGNCTSGERWGLRVNGSSLTVFRGGSSVLTATDTSLTTGTRVALNNYEGSTTATYDNFHANTYSSDTTAPSVVSRTVNGATLTITYDEALDTTYVPATSAYTVKVNGSTRSVTNVAVANSGAAGAGVVTLTLSSAVVAGDSVTVSYVP